MSSNLLKELSIKQPHPCKIHFEGLNNQPLARALGISPNYCYDVLNGSKRPGPDLNKRIYDLAERVMAEREAEEQAECAHA